MGTDDNESWIKLSIYPLNLAVHLFIIRTDTPAPDCQLVHAFRDVSPPFVWHYFRQSPFVSCFINLGRCNTCFFLRSSILINAGSVSISCSMFWFILWLFRIYFAVRLMNFISASVILNVFGLHFSSFTPHGSGGGFLFWYVLGVWCFKYVA